MELNLQKTKHPNLKDHEIRYNNLIGLDLQKTELLMTLIMILNSDLIDGWEKKHHNKKLPFLKKGLKLNPLIILSGEVGCGKTELALTIGTPLAKMLDKPVISLQTPSDIRGVGFVGQLSARITESFVQAKKEIGTDCGILIIDEGDDLASSRSQMQSHHEDKAGVNVLIKEIDGIEQSKTSLAVILITNRMSSLDPAIVRRACLHVEFKRPTDSDLQLVFKYILDGTVYSEDEINKLTAFAVQKTVPYSYSDLLQRVAKQALIKSITDDIAFNATTLLQILEKTEPTPLILNHD